MLRKEKPLIILIVVTSAFLLCLSASHGIISAEETLPAVTEEKPVIDSRADKLLEAMGDYLKISKQFSFHANITFDDLIPSGQKIQYASSSDIAIVGQGFIRAGCVVRASDYPTVCFVE